MLWHDFQKYTEVWKYQGRGYLYLCIRQHFSSVTGVSVKPLQIWTFIILQHTFFRKKNVQHVKRLLISWRNYINFCHCWTEIDLLCDKCRLLFLQDSKRWQVHEVAMSSQRDIRWWLYCTKSDTGKSKGRSGSVYSDYEKRHKLKIKN